MYARILLICSAPILFTISASAASSRTGVVLKVKRVHKIRSFSGLTEQKEEETHTLSSSGVRIETAGSRVIEAYRTEAPKSRKKDAKAKETLYRWNKSTKIFVEKDLAQMRAEDEALRKRIEEQRGRMNRDGGGGGGMLGALAGLSRQSQGEPEGKITTKKSEKTVKIAGYTCEHVQFLQDDNVICEVWVAGKLKKVRKASALAPGKKLWLENNDAMKSRPKLLAARLAVEGLELKSIVRKAAGQHYTVEVTKVTEKTISSSAFKPPAGFKKVEREAELYRRPRRR